MIVINNFILNINYKLNYQLFNIVIMFLDSATRHSDKFFDFLIRTTRYNSVFNCNERRLMLVKDIPNIYFFEKDSFHNLLE